MLLSLLACLHAIMSLTLNAFFKRLLSTFFNQFLNEFKVNKLTNIVRNYEREDGHFFI